ncbi:hypothetical protein FOA52_001364 [Chlamydomonas sp. UWO 241]|nr:hypothetical protein FOA52_001364 [Chlamydomonas sp. UWO 241]
MGKVQFGCASEHVTEVDEKEADSRAARLIPAADRGRISAQQIAGAINADDPHYPRTRLVCLENTTNKGGGACYSLSALKDVRALCTEKGLALHLDGARVFNAIVESGEYSPKELGQVFDSISVCLSKGLGCPVGSLLLGTREFIARARRVRKLLGGGMRQAGLLAAAGLYALEHNIERLKEDHARARQLGEALQKLAWVEKVAPVETNIVIFTLAQGCPDAPDVMAKLKDKGLAVSPMGSGLLRLVTHLDVSQADVDAAIGVLNAFEP